MIHLRQTMNPNVDFYNTWLIEMPMGVGQVNSYNQIVYNIKERIDAGSKVVKLPDNLCKIQGTYTIFYWYEINDTIPLCIELRVAPYGLIVSLVGKNLAYKGKPLYASDLYNAILNDNKNSIRIFSDDQLSDEGYNIWKKLYLLGDKVSVYDRVAPGATFITLNSIDDLDSFFKHDDSKYMQYQYVLSKADTMLSETRCVFNTRRFKELSGYII